MIHILNDGLIQSGMFESNSAGFIILLNVHILKIARIIMSPKSGNPEYRDRFRNHRHIQRIGASEEGFRVTVVDREDPDNRVLLEMQVPFPPSSALPNSLPGMMFKVPGWLFREDGPLFIQWQYFPKLIPWLIRFLNSANWDKVDETTSSLLALHASCFRLYQDLVKEIGAEDLIVESPVITSIKKRKISRVPEHMENPQRQRHRIMRNWMNLLSGK